MHGEPGQRLGRGLKRSSETPGGVSAGIWGPVPLSACSRATRSADVCSRIYACFWEGRRGPRCVSPRALPTPPGAAGSTGGAFPGLARTSPEEAWGGRAVGAWQGRSSWGSGCPPPSLLTRVTSKPPFSGREREASLARGGLSPWCLTPFWSRVPWECAVQPSQAHCGLPKRGGAVLPPFLKS